MKGIILAGGSGTRLYPLTHSVSKQLLPVYDKPVIYYPLSILMLAQIKEILIISTPRDLKMIESLLGSGEHLGLRLSYQEQPQPNGIAEAFLIGEKFIDGQPVCLILGDNLFYGHRLSEVLKEAFTLKEGGRIFAYQVQDPERYGVIEFDQNENPSQIIEKPKNTHSPWAVTGLYFYDSTVVEVARNLKPSSRGELEITDVNLHYLKQGKLQVTRLNRGITWLDLGTPDALLAAGSFVQSLEKRQGLKVSCIEEIAYHRKHLSAEKLKNLIETRYQNTPYGEYLQKILKHSNDSI